MFILIGGTIVIILVLVGLAWSLASAPQDNREQFFTDPTGFGLALRVSGEQGHLIAHEDIVHDGTPHQNPHVEQSVGMKWWPFPRAVVTETRYYPLTIGVDGQIPNLPVIQQRVNELFQMGHDVSIGPMPPHAQRGVLARENAVQLGRGVASRRLYATSRGRRRRFRSPI